MELHTYQKNCLRSLSAFLAAMAEREQSPQQVFAAMQNRPYYPPPFLPESMPYVCIRIPTGGGKTLLAAHAAGRTAKEYLKAKTPTILWLAPSDAIVSQTLKLLKDTRHPCHLALAKYFHGVNCISVADALRVNKHDMDEAATVIVATVQSLRRSQTAKLKIYDDNGALMPHFYSLPDELRDELEQEDGGIFRSLANVIKLRRPIVVSDEAHNSGTSLSFESLARFAPSCILEFTATPQTRNAPAQKKYPSNVISQASARELQNANMIKFPLNFEVHSDWRENIRAAVVKRDKLEAVAKKEKDYIRPIVLYQAENANETATADVVKQALLELGVSTEEIAVHTGTTRELQKQANTDLFSPQCPIRHIITVKALTEGWDCSFAYILCTMANMQSEKAVEQILGRILRLPGARRQSQKSLNECYAFASRGNVAQVAENLKDTLVKKSGFQIMEAADFINLPDDCPLLPGFGRPTLAPTRRGIKPLVVPLLAVRESGVLDLLERAHFLGTKWSIAKAKPNMSDFSPPTITVGRGVIFVREDGKVKVKPGGEGDSPDSADAIHGQLMLLEADKKWTVATLAAELDADIEHPDIPQTESAPFILAAVNQLAKKYTIPQLARWLPYIKKRLESDIDKLRREQIQKGWQQMLLMKAVEGGRLELSAEHAVSFERRRYAPHWLCPAADMFRKHLFPEVGELKGGGEEWDCACFLDSMPEVEVWVRNLDQRDNSFGLQTSSDKFYPDFVCRLTDGRIMVVEYKAEKSWSDEDSTEKRNLGEMWAAVGGDKYLFVMPKGRNNLNAIEECVRGE